ncbi:hypothetical protein GW17_00033497 [Ensete ventricosum]|nr:hypothetical protein GW17_00033497 [Ensete ventricosum]RZS03322.1 hypothetical protein BHM03_00033490 [Ensete ventricosum]
MGRSALVRVLDCFSLAVSPGSCVCMNTWEEEDEGGFEEKSLIKSHVEQVLKIKDVLDGGKTTLAFHLEPKVGIPLAFSRPQNIFDAIHTTPSAGVTSFEVDLEKKKVVVVGDITPFEVLKSVSKVKFAELWLT